MADFFGSGVLFATPQSDADGNAIAVASPVQIGILQGVTISDEQEVKELYGANKYPVDIGGGKAKLMIKAKSAQFNAQLFNAVYYGQSLVGGYDAVLADSVGSTVPGTAGSTSVHVVATGGASSLFVADLGVQQGDGTPYIRVASAPTGGEYQLTTGANSSGATYTFGDQDVGKLAFINYQYSNAGNFASARVLTVNNKPMGIQPVLSCQFFAKRFLNGASRTVWRKFPNVVALKLSMDWKNDDFVVPDFEMQAFADSNNVVQQWSWTE